MSNKILLVGKDRKYFFAEKDKENITLKSTKKSISTTDVVPYGFNFTFGEPLGKIDFGTMSYDSYIYQELSKEEGIQKNLDLTVEGLEKIVEDAKADFILVDNLISQDYGTSWKISGKAQLLIKR